MQGRQGPDDQLKSALDRSATSGYRFTEEALKKRQDQATGAYRFTDLTGRQPVVPKRPPGMSPHMDTPPPTPRVARPEMKKSKPKTWRWWLVALVIALIAVPVVFVLVNGVSSFFFAVSTSYGPANTAVNFLSDVESGDYDQAYKNLYPTVTVQMSSSDFKQAALADDSCFGKMTDYQEVAGSATTSSDQNLQSFTYTITRSKLKSPYQLTISLQKDATGTWFITGYGTNNELGPSTPNCG